MSTGFTVLVVDIVLVGEVLTVVVNEVVAVESVTEAVVVVVVVDNKLGVFSTQKEKTSFISTRDIPIYAQALCGNSPTLFQPKFILSNWYIPCSG